MAKTRKQNQRPVVDRGEAPVNWGSAKDVQQFDAALAQSYQQSVETFTRLFQRLSREGADRTRITPWLLIRYAPTDLGSRPIPTNQAFWESPDIWVETEDPLGNPVAGKPNYVHARLFNLGAFVSAPVKVDFYWGDPSIGLDAAHMHLIGSEYVEVPSLWSRDVRCNAPWVPVVENQGHECLMVNCSNWLADPIIDPFEPILDRHVGQRNVHVVQASAGMMLSEIIQLGNLLLADARVELWANIAYAALDGGKGARLFGQARGRSTARAKTLRRALCGSLADRAKPLLLPPEDASGRRRSGGSDRRAARARGGRLCRGPADEHHAARRRTARARAQARRAPGRRGRRVHRGQAFSSCGKSDHGRLHARSPSQQTINRRKKRR